MATRTFPRYVTFAHASPYATWNAFQAWCRLQRRVPEQVTLAHLATVDDHADVTAAGLRRLLDHMGAGEQGLERLRIPDNRLDTWIEALQRHVDAQRDPTALDVTAARTIPKLAAARVARPGDEHEIVYLDVQGYRYEAKPFAYIPYNIQTVRMLRSERTVPSYRRMQFFGPMPGTPPMARASGVRKVGPGRYEVSRPWESLIVLLNEAGAAKRGRTDDVGVEAFTIKLPAYGVTVATYDLETRRLRMTPWATLTEEVHAARALLPSAWRGEVPDASFILEALASARLMDYADQASYEGHLHRVAMRTRGPNPGMNLQALALDTNMFYLEFFTSVAHAAGVPMTRIPVVASAISLQEIRHKMDARFPAGDMPRVLRECDIHNPLAARRAHSAHEEFQMLRTRCAMTVIDRHLAQQGHADRNTANDAAIIEDLAWHQRTERQELLVLSNDKGFAERAQAHGGLQARQLDYPHPDEAVRAEADVDQVAYFLYRLALGYGLVNLTGLQVALHGDHPRAASDGFLNESVRVRMPDTEWTRGFLHETALREPLREVVAAGGIWL